MAVSLHKNDHKPYGVELKFPVTAVQPVAQADARILVNGEPVTFDAAPVMVNGRTYVPFRAIFEALGASVGYDAATSTVSARANGIDMAFRVGAVSAQVNGRQGPMADASFVLNGRTEVPLRFISESLGFTVEWTPDWVIRIDDAS